MSLAMIVAMDRNRVIGRDGGLPWRLSSDLRRFKRITMGHHLLMGRVTWDSLGRPLPGRTSIVISRQQRTLPEGVLCAGSVEQAVALAAGDDLPFVIGGAQIYQLSLPLATHLFLTEVSANVDGDTYFPDFDRSAWTVREQEDVPASDKDQFAHRFQLLVR